MRTVTFGIACVATCVSLASVAPGQVAPVPATSNLLTQYLDWADINPARQVGSLTVFPITQSRSVHPVQNVLSMQQALDRGVLAIEELASARVSGVRFVNKSRDQMIFLMAGELITGGKQNRTLQSDALLGPGTTTDLPMYCVQKGRWQGGQKFGGSSTVVPQGVREKALSSAGQDAVWSEVARANARLATRTASDDLAAAMTKPENVRRLADLRKRIVPHLPRNCVGVVAAVGGRIVGADLFSTPALFSAMRDKVLNSYLSQYGWTGPILRDREKMPVRPTVTAEQVRDYLRDCYRSRLVSGERRGVGQLYHVRGVRAGQTLGYNDRSMVHTSLVSPAVLPVRPRPLPRPRPIPMPEPRR